MELLSLDNYCPWTISLKRCPPPPTEITTGPLVVFHWQPPGGGQCCEGHFSCRRLSRGGVSCLGRNCPDILLNCTMIIRKNWPWKITYPMEHFGLWLTFNDKILPPFFVPTTSWSFKNSITSRDYNSITRIAIVRISQWNGICKHLGYEEKKIHKIKLLWGKIDMNSPGLGYECRLIEWRVKWVCSFMAEGSINLRRLMPLLFIPGLFHNYDRCWNSRWR